MLQRPQRQRSRHLSQALLQRQLRHHHRVEAVIGVAFRPAFHRAFNRVLVHPSSPVLEVHRLASVVNHLGLAELLGTQTRMELGLVRLQVMLAECKATGKELVQEG